MTPKRPTLKLPTLDPWKARGLKVLDTGNARGLPMVQRKTLKQQQQATGRTLALNGEAWRRLRAQVLAEQPLCLECRDQGLLVSATDVDHHDNDPSNNSRDNLIGLCHSHHSIKTNRDRGHKPRYGCDEHGMPLDPCHHWNVAPEGRKSPATGKGESDGSLRFNANRTP